MILLRALLLASVVSLSALPATAPDVITPPAGWSKESLRASRSAALGYVLAQWISFDRGTEEYIEIGRRSSGGFDEPSFVAFYQDYLKRTDHRILASRATGLCHGERGWFLKSLEPVRYGGNVHADVVFVDGSHVYFASYVYPPSLQGAASAERAIESLCISKPVIVKPLVLPVAFTAPRDWYMSDPKESDGPVWPGTIALYYSAQHPGDTLMLAREQLPGETLSPTDQTRERDVETMMKRENVNVKLLGPQTHSLERLCGDHFALHFHYTVAYGKAHFAYEQLTLLGMPLYSALYIRPVGAKPNAHAMAALATLCPLTPASAPKPSPLSTQIYVITPAPEPTFTP